MSLSSYIAKYDEHIKTVIEYLSFDMNDVEIVSVLEYRELNQNEIRLCMFAGKKEFNGLSK